VQRKNVGNTPDLMPPMTQKGTSGNQTQVHSVYSSMSRACSLWIFNDVTQKEFKVLFSPYKTELQP